jgi:hypothetical protein
MSERKYCENCECLEGFCVCGKPAPRECTAFYVKNHMTGAVSGANGRPCIEDEEAVRMIEHSAYAAVAKENAELRAELGHEKLDAFYRALRDAPPRLKHPDHVKAEAERDRYRLILEQILEGSYRYYEHTEGDLSFPDYYTVIREALEGNKS